MMVIDNKYELGQLVYVKVEGQRPVMVIEISVVQHGLLYRCGRADGEAKTFYECELSETRQEYVI